MCLRKKTLMCFTQQQNRLGDHQECAVSGFSMSEGDEEEAREVGDLLLRPKNGMGGCWNYVYQGSGELGRVFGGEDPP